MGIDIYLIVDLLVIYSIYIFRLYLSGVNLN